MTLAEEDGSQQKKKKETLKMKTREKVFGTLFLALFRAKLQLSDVR